MNAINTRKFEQDGFTVIVEHFYDSDMTRMETPEALQANYTGESAEDKAKYFAQDKARYESWLHDEWCYIGVSVTIRKQTETNWADGGLEVGRASIWGVENDNAEYVASLEVDMIVEAFAEVGRLKIALDLCQ